MGDGGGSSAGAAGGSDGGQAASSGVAAGQNSVATGETAVSEDAGETKETVSKESKTAKLGAAVDDKAVTVKEAKDKSTIDRDHVEGEEKPKEDKEVKEEKKAHKYHDRLSKAYPGRAFADDNEYESAHEELVTDLLGYKERGTKANEKLIGLFEAEPQVADIVRSMINGETFRAAIARHVSPEDLATKPGDPDYEAWDKNTKDRTERISKTEQRNKEFNDNIEFSTKAIDEFALENKMTPEKAEEFLGKVDEMLQPIYQGKISKETLAKIMKAIDFDAAVVEAKEEGAIAEKNKKVIAEKEKETQVGDGLPAMKKSGGEEKEEHVKPEAHSIIDRITEGAKKRQIF